jgi:hypothetical protein
MSCSTFGSTQIPISDIEKIQKRDTPTQRLVLITYRHDSKVKTAKFAHNSYPDKTLKKLTADLRAINPNVDVHGL